MDQQGDLEVMGLKARVGCCHRLSPRKSGLKMECVHRQYSSGTHGLATELLGALARGCSVDGYMAEESSNQIRMVLVSMPRSMA